jgi:YidC/Oxa1 family membrane protein insertase
MEKRALIAIAASFLILVLWSYVFPPPERPPQPEPVTITGTEPSPEPQPVAAEPALAVEDELAPLEEEPDAPQVAAEREESLVIETGNFTVGLTNRGGVATSWRLHHYTANGGEPLELFPRFVDQKRFPLSVVLDDMSLAELLNESLYQVERERLPRREELGSGERVTFTWSDGRALSATKSFTFWSESWLVEVRLEVIDRGRKLPARLAVGPGFGAQESRKGLSTYAYSGQGLWNLSGNVTRLKPRKIVGQDGAISGNLLWAGLEDQYFTALVLPSAAPASAAWTSLELLPIPPAGVEDGEDFEVEAAKQPIVGVLLPDGEGELYIGPKRFRQLQALGHDLDKAVWFATNPILYAITKYIFFALLWIYDNVVENYGLAIIIATILLRLLLFPVNQYSMVSMKKTQLQMQRLQPKIKAIRNKYKKSKDAQNRQKINEETMALYKKEGVNPMGGVTGCLPLLAQFPILISFYFMLTVAIELRGAPFFGWITDLSQKDPYWIIPLLMGVTMFVQQRMSMSKVKDPQMQQQQKFMMIMPFVFTYICLQMPSGMVLYWFVNNLLGIGQQWLVNRHTGRLEAAAQKV